MPGSGRKRRWIAIALFVGLMLALAMIASRRPPRKPEFLDATRAAAYSNLIAAASQLTGELNSTNKAEFLAQNKAVIEAVRRAIANPIEMPDEMYQRENFAISHIALPKSLSRALVAKGETYTEQKEYRKAVDVYFDTIRLGERFEHGVLINYLVGAGIERYALKRLEETMGKLSNRDLEELAPKLQELNAGRITIEEIFAREHYFMSLNATNIVDAVRSRFSGQTRSVFAKARESHRTLRAQVEIAAATMAMLRYSRENGLTLTNVEALAPKYLPKVPMDSYSHGPLLIAREGTNAPVIYSVGPNGRDDGGTGDDIRPAQRDSTWIQVLSNVMGAK